MKRAEDVPRLPFRLLTVLVAGLAVLLLLPAVARADQTDEATRLVDQTNALLDQSYGLVSEIDGLLTRVSRIDPASQNAGDALPLLKEATALLDEVIATHTSILSLNEETAALELGSEFKVYVAQRKEVTQLELELYGLIGEVIANHKTAYNQWNQLSESDRARLGTDVNDLFSRWDVLATKIEKKQAAAEQYYSDELGDSAQESWTDGLIGDLIWGVPLLIVLAIGWFRRRRRRRQGLVECANCGIEMSAKATECPNCGHDPRLADPVPLA